MNTKATDISGSPRYLGRGSNIGGIDPLQQGPLQQDPSQQPENDATIPYPFGDTDDTSQDQTMERLDEALHSTGAEVIADDDPNDADADDPGQA
jgi:hypothetical protein